MLQRAHEVASEGDAEQAGRLVRLAPRRAQQLMHAAARARPVQLLVQRHAAHAPRSAHVRAHRRRRRITAAPRRAVGGAEPPRRAERPERGAGELRGEEVEELAAQPARVLPLLARVLDAQLLPQHAAAHAHLPRGARGAVVRRAMLSRATVGREGSVTSEKAPSASTVEPSRSPRASRSRSSWGGARPSSGGRAAARLAVQKASRACSGRGLGPGQGEGWGLLRARAGA